MVEYAELRGFLGGMLWNGREPVERSRVEVNEPPLPDPPPPLGRSGGKRKAIEGVAAWRDCGGWDAE